MTMNAIKAFDISLLSREARTRFYLDAVRSARLERSRAVRDLFRALAQRTRRRPALHALASSVAVFAAVIAIGTLLSGPSSAAMGNISIGNINPSPRITAVRVEAKQTAPGSKLKK